MHSTKHTYKNEIQIRAVRSCVGSRLAGLFRLYHSDDKERRVSIARVRVLPWQRLFQGVLSAEPAHAGAVPVSQRCRGHVPSWVQGTVRLSGFVNSTGAGL